MTTESAKPIIKTNHPRGLVYLMESNRIALNRMLADLNVLVFPTDIAQISREYCQGLFTLVDCLDKINNILTLRDLRELYNDIIGDVGFLYLKADLILANVNYLTTYPGSLRKIPNINESIITSIMDFGKTIDSAFDIGHGLYNWYSRDRLKILNTLLLHLEFNPTVLDVRDTPWNLVLGENVLYHARHLDQGFQLVTEFILSLSSAIFCVKAAITDLPTVLGYLSNNTEYLGLNNTLIPVSTIINKWELKNERS